MPPSNMSIQPGSVDAAGRLRPSMQQDSHPEHNMPAPEHNGVPAGTRGSMGRGASLSDMSDRGSIRAPLQEAMPVSPSGSMDSY